MRLYACLLMCVLIQTHMENTCIPKCTNAQPNTLRAHAHACTHSMHTHI